jgi:peptidoglycan/xylan/chitin deacetylase (PgdA/CDA1 family)
VGKLSNALGFYRGAEGLAVTKQSRVPILLYHRFHPTEPSTPWTVTTRVFEEQLQWFSDNRYRIVPLRSVVDNLRGTEPPIPQPAIAITVDDGDRSVYTDMFPIIQRLQVPVTLFIYPYAISLSSSALTWEELEEMVQSGLVNVQFHTLSHPDFRHERTRRSPGDYQAFVQFELCHFREKIEQRLHLTVDMLAWPFGIYDSELEKAAATAGYAVAFAVKNHSPNEDSIFAVPRISIHNRDCGEGLRARITPTRPSRFLGRS